MYNEYEGWHESNQIQNAEVELYIHIPFCRTKCKFCFHVSFAEVGEAKTKAYLCALEQEIGFRWDDWGRRRPIINSLYIGGGTPSSLSLWQLEKLNCILTRFWDLAEIAEVTVECNPSSTDKAKLKALKAMGVSRISLGIQNLDDQLLQSYNREGTRGRFNNLLNTARSVGFENISCDALLGLPGETSESIERTLDSFIKNSVPHISIYPFSLSNNTDMFYNAQLRREYLMFKAERTELFRRSAEFLQECGYHRLSTTHFALEEKYDCLQYSNYWNGGNVLGFGASALSFVDVNYIQNKSVLDDYLDGVPDRTHALLIPLGKNDLIRRWAVMRLSKKMGFHYAALEARFGTGSLQYIEEELMDLSKAGLAYKERDGIRLTVKGMEQIQLIPAFYLRFESEEYLQQVMRLPEENSTFLINSENT